jgi:signal transduction histidine kinase
VKCRRVDLELILRNLIDNAVKYADGAQPQVRVFCRYDPARSKVVVQIADNGSGIPHKLRRKIFGRFTRLGPELERNKPGTGLGLYIVRTLVDRLRGRIHVSSRDDGAGTLFEVSLPGAQARATQMPAHDAVASPRRPVPAATDE